MKRILAVLALAAASISVASCATGGSGRTMLIDLPAPACALGLCGSTPIWVSLAPQLPFYGKVVAAAGSRVVEIAGCALPGTSFYDPRHAGGPHAELSVGVFLYSDLECTNLVGVAGEVLRINRGWGAGFDVTLGRVKRTDTASTTEGAGFSLFSVPPLGRSQRVSFPRLTLSEQPILILNGTRYQASVRENGREVLVIPPGEANIIYHHLLYEGWSVPATTNIVFFDEAGRGMGCYVQRFALSKQLSGPRSHIVVAGGDDVRPCR